MQRDMQGVPGPNLRGAGLTFVVALDKFKDALPAGPACAAVADGLRRALPEATVASCPMADGGEGTAAALADNLGCDVVTRHRVTGPLPDQRVEAVLRRSGDREVALIDMSDAAGIELVPRGRRNPLNTTSHGVGELIRIAADDGVRKVYLGLGGSATCDAGLGAAQALGLEIWLEGGKLLDRPFVGGDLPKVEAVHVPVLGLAADVTCLCDVDTPLIGEQGAANAFAPQKGANTDEVRLLAEGLERLVEITARLGDEPCSGAAGGLAYGLGLVGRVDARNGAELVLEACDLADRLNAATLCVTGEGRFDAGSLRGKVVAAVGRACQKAEVPCVVLAGGIDLDAAADAGSIGVTATFPIGGPCPIEQALPQTADRLTTTGEHLGRLIAAIGPHA